MLSCLHSLLPQPRFPRSGDKRRRTGGRSAALAQPGPPASLPVSLRAAARDGAPRATRAGRHVELRERPGRTGQREATGTAARPGRGAAAESRAEIGAGARQLLLLLLLPPPTRAAGPGAARARRAPAPRPAHLPAASIRRRSPSARSFFPARRQPGKRPERRRNGPNPPRKDPTAVGEERTSPNARWPRPFPLSAGCNRDPAPAAE